MRSEVKNLVSEYGHHSNLVVAWVLEDYFNHKLTEGHNRKTLINIIRDCIRSHTTLFHRFNMVMYQNKLEREMLDVYFG